jgi:hypothetical protein
MGFNSGLKGLMPPSNHLSKAISEIHVHIVIFITSLQPSTGSHTNKPSKHLASQSLTPPTNHSQAKTSQTFIHFILLHIHYTKSIKSYISHINYLQIKTSIRGHKKLISVPFCDKVIIKYPSNLYEGPHLQHTSI